MHQTTVRFGPDLWTALEEECGRLGVSVAQYVRESALTRIVYAAGNFTAGRRGDEAFESALELATGTSPPSEPQEAEELEAVARSAGSAPTAQERAFRGGTETAALAAQGQLARQRARELRQLAVRRRTG